MSVHHAAAIRAGGVTHTGRMAAAGDGIRAIFPARLADAQGVLWGLGAAAIASGWWTVTRVAAADGLHAEDLVAMRFGIAGLLLLPLAWRERAAIARAGLVPLLFMILGAGAPYVLVAGTGVQLASAGIGGAITVGLMPVFTLILSVLVLRERVTRPLAIGMTTILVGAACVLAGAWDGAAHPLGLALFVLGALMWAGYGVALRRSGLPPLTATSVVCVASLLIAVPFWLFTAGPERILAAAPGDLMLQAGYQALLSSIGLLYCFGRTVARLGAARASVFGAIVPTFSVIIAAVVLGESPTTAALLGALLLSAGAAVAALRHTR